MINPVATGWVGDKERKQNALGLDAANSIGIAVFTTNERVIQPSRLNGAEARCVVQIDLGWSGGAKRGESQPREPSRQGLEPGLGGFQRVCERPRTNRGSPADSVQNCCWWHTQLGDRGGGPTKARPESACRKS